MKRPSGYATICIAVGLFTATLIGLSVASYVKSRKGISKRLTVSDTMSKRLTVSDTIGISPPQYMAK
jgi:hypothetical protein